jgi:hypothetical protein
VVGIEPATITITITITTIVAGAENAVAGDAVSFTVAIVAAIIAATAIAAMVKLGEKEPVVVAAQPSTPSPHPSTPLLGCIRTHMLCMLCMRMCMACWEGKLVRVENGPEHAYELAARAAWVAARRTTRRQLCGSASRRRRHRQHRVSHLAYGEQQGQCAHELV